MDIRTVTIIGANGTMGKNIAGIFASFGQAKVYLVTRSIEKSTVACSDAYNSVKAESIKDNLIPKTYNDLEECISNSDLVFESLSEDINLKLDVYKKIEKYIDENTILATGTSGISIERLSKGFGKYAKNFFGIHMFNPPYNLTLCELITYDDCQEEMAKELEEYLASCLRRTVVRVKDKPAFLGNNIGFFFINEVLKLAEEYKEQGGIDYIDAIFGGFTGRSMSPLVTADFVGLDITKSIIDYVYENTNNEYKDSFLLPSYINNLIEQKFIGNKVNKGLYYDDTDRNIVFVYDIKTEKYRIKNNYQFYFANEIIKFLKNGQYEEAIKFLIEEESSEAIICKKMLICQNKM